MQLKKKPVASEGVLQNGQFVTCSEQLEPHCEFHQQFTNTSDVSEINLLGRCRHFFSLPDYLCVCLLSVGNLTNLIKLIPR